MAEDTAPDGGAEADRAADILSRLLAEGDFTEEELADRLLAVADATNLEAEGAVVEPAAAEALEREVDEQLGELEDRLEELDAEFQAKIEDVRKRVLQVKRLTDTKAASDHQHEEVRELSSELEAVAGELSDVERRVNEGFENYESILEYLSDSLDTVTDRLSVLAEAVVSLRDEVDIIVEQATYTERLAALTETANEHGIRRARCDSCSGRVDLSLLQEPRCPHCQSLFQALDANTGFFGAHTLSVDEAPALEGETVDRTELASILNAETASSPDRSGTSTAPPEDDEDAKSPGENEATGDGDAESSRTQSGEARSGGFVFNDT